MEPRQSPVRGKGLVILLSFFALAVAVALLR